MATILDGKLTQEKIREELKIEIDEFREQGLVPGLGIIQVGNRKDSDTYIRMKERACKNLGIFFMLMPHDENVSVEHLKESVRFLNENNQIHGIIVQLPLPIHLNEAEILGLVRKDKDVDGFHPENTGNLMLKRLDKAMVPCTPSGCIELLDRYDIPLLGKHVVVLGRSNIVGLPMALLALHRNATISICHSRTENIMEITKTADILVCACGKREMVDSSWIKEGCVIIDVGINAVEDKTKKSGYRLVGDVNYNSVIDKVSAITPVPGGVGPMTIGMLLKHTVQAFKNQTFR